MEHLSVIAWAAFIICVFLVWFFSHRAKHKERLMIIEKTFENEELSKENRKADLEELLYKDRRFRFPWLKLGIVVLGLSIGLLIISLLIVFNLLEKGGNVLPLAILGLCGGIAMVVANFLTGNKDK